MAETEKKTPAMHRLQKAKCLSLAESLIVNLPECSVARALAIAARNEIERMEERP